MGRILSRSQIKMKKGFLDISFSWIFALIIGATILFAAIYFVTQFSEVKNSQTSAESGTTFFNLLLPLETGIESGKSVRIKFPVKTRLNHICETSGTFGREGLSIQEFIKNKWTENGINIYSEDKYVFYPKLIEGKEFFSFSKSFEFPFKIANLVYLTDAEKIYCFSGTPNEVKEELENFNNPNFKFENCQSPDAVNVCFSSGDNCNIEVKMNAKEIVKEGKIVYFEGNSLMYAAIFSDEIIYECELQRLMKRGVQLTDLYKEKSLRLYNLSCQSDMTLEFSGLQNQFLNLEDSENLYYLRNSIEEISLMNRYSGCPLW